MRALVMRTVSGVLIWAITLGAGCADPGEGGPRGGIVPLATPTAPEPDGRRAMPEEPRADRLVVVAGGDVNLGRAVGQRLLADPAYHPLRAVAPIFSAADVSFVNLESPLSDQGGETRHPSEALAFTGPPSGAEALARAGVDVVSLANNHAWDYGRDGFFETVANLQRAGLAVAGASTEADVSHRPAWLRVKGWRIAVLAVTHVWNAGDFEAHEGRRHVAWAEPERLLPEVRRARAEADVVIVSYHGGQEYSPYPAKEPVDLARAAIEAGADVFVGHHPHVPQGVGWIDGKPVLYSLGNLVFGENQHHPWTGRGVLARLRFGAGRSVELALCPYRIEREEPVALPAEGRAGWLRVFRSHLGRLSHYATVGGVFIDSEEDQGCLRVAERG